MLARDGRAIPTTPDVTADGRWVETCECGRETRILNGGYRVVPALAPLLDCNAPHPQPGGALLVEELGWSRDGEAAALDVEMLDYLRYAAEPQAFKTEDGLRPFLMTAYVAESLGWTTYGTYFWAGWLTPAGEEALRNYTAHLAVPA